jgi:hypothetical protein
MSEITDLTELIEFTNTMIQDTFNINFEGSDLVMSEESEPLPSSMCPVCGSYEIEIEDGKGKCNTCGSEMTYQISVTVDKWSTDDKKIVLDSLPEIKKKDVIIEEINRFELMEIDDGSNL